MGPERRNVMMKAREATRLCVTRQSGGFMTDQITDIKLEHPHQEVDEHTGRFDTGEELEPE